VEAFGDAVVAREAPHGGDFLSACVQGVARLNERWKAGGSQFGDVS
jgi:hypothetical protein